MKMDMSVHLTDSVDGPFDDLLSVATKQIVKAMLIKKETLIVSTLIALGENRDSLSPNNIVAHGAVARCIDGSEIYFWDGVKILKFYPMVTALSDDGRKIYAKQDVECLA